MSNPYTQPSIAGYNANPPADDGTTVSANQLKWANHVTKLAGPVKTFAEAIDSATLAAFGLVFGAAVLTKTSAYTVTTADRGRFFAVTGTTTITLLPAATAGSGFPLLIVNTGSDTVTVDGNSSETINGAVTQVLAPNEGLIISSTGALWIGLITRTKTTGSANLQVTGGTGGTPIAMAYELREGLCTLHSGSSANVVTSTSTALTLPDLPSAIQPATTIAMPTIVINNGSSNQQAGRVTISGSTMTFGMGSPISDTGFTASNTKGIPIGWSITYPLS